MTSDGIQPPASDIAIPTADWAARSGDLWARRWKETDAGLAGLSTPLLDAIRRRAPGPEFRAFEVGCGPGTTTLSVADSFPNADITACDISPSLAQIAAHRLAGRPKVRVIAGDAEALAPGHAPIDLIFSRHGMMFFDDPLRAFRGLRAAMASDGSLIFSCFRDWALNPWASELASAAAGRALSPPGREPGGFAFADPVYVQTILDQSGWTDSEPQPVDFPYVAGAGEAAVDLALSFLADLGPAARLLEALDRADREPALQRMRGVIERFSDGSAVIFPAAAWIWSARAA